MAKAAKQADAPNNTPVEATDVPVKVVATFPAPENHVGAEMVTAKNAVMSAAGYIQKEKKEGLNYTFASEAEIISKVNPAMVANGLAIAPAGIYVITFDGIEVGSKGTRMGHMLAIFVFRLTHKSGQWEDIHVLGEGADMMDKAANKAMTAAYKYALRQAFCIETGDDPDYTPSPPNTEGRNQLPASAPTPNQPAKNPNATAPHAAPNAGPAPQAPAPKQAPGPTPPNNAPSNGAGPHTNGAPQLTAQQIQDKFQQRKSGVQACKKMTTLNTFRKLWSEDKDMTDPMKAELETLYWLKAGELDPQPEPVPQ